MFSELDQLPMAGPIYERPVFGSKYIWVAVCKSASESSFKFDWILFCFVVALSAGFAQVTSTIEPSMSVSESKRLQIKANQLLVD